MAVWSMVLPQTANCVSPLPGFEYQPGHLRKLSVTWGQVVGFSGDSGCLPYLQLACHELASLWHKK